MPNLVMPSLVTPSLDMRSLAMLSRSRGTGSKVALGATCYAGVYTCALPQGLPVGSQCSCPGLGAPSYGNVR